MILSRSAIREIINNHWNFSIEFPIVFAEEISNHGSDNVIFSTANGEKFVFRIIFMEPDVIHDGSQIYEILHNSGIAVPLPVKTDNGEYTINANLEDRKAGYSIHTFVEGNENINKSMLNSYIDHLGEELGKLHSALFSIDVRDMNLRGREVSHFTGTGIGFHSPLEDVIPNDPIVQEMYEFWNNWKDQLDLSQFTSGIVHGDIGPGCNIMMQNQKVSAFIDLIGVGGGLYMTDVASFVMYGGLYREERETWLNKFKENYLKTSPVSRKEFDTLPFFILWRFLIQALYFGWRLRINYTQGNTPDSDNQVGMDDALYFLDFWKKKYSYLM